MDLPLFLQTSNSVFATFAVFFAAINVILLLYCLHKDGERRCKQCFLLISVGIILLAASEVQEHLETKTCEKMESGIPSGLFETIALGVFTVALYLNIRQEAKEVAAPAKRRAK